MIKYEALINDVDLHYFLNRYNLHIEKVYCSQPDSLDIRFWSDDGFKCRFRIPFSDLIEFYCTSILAERLLRALEHRYDEYLLNRWEVKEDE